jgi:MFS transporter, DHA2 family, methylenomycin A resistance protein
MSQDEPAATPSSRWRVLTVMCVGYFLVLLDVTVINVALPQIGSGLGSNTSGLQWVVDGYALALATLLLAGGTLGDLYGHKRVVLTGVVVFGLASLACGLAPNTELLVAATVLQGIGAALLLPGTLAIITNAFPEPDRQARAIGIWAGIGSLALPAGPLLGGALVQGLGWRAVFFLNLPIVMVAGAVALRVVHESREAEGRRLDPAGIALGGLLLAAVTFAFIQAGHTGLGAPVLVAIAVALVSLGCFLVVERSTPDPMLPLVMLTRRSFSTANAVAGMMNLGTLGLLFLLTLYLQTVQHRSPLNAGIAVLPLFLPLSALAPIAGRLNARLGPKLPMALGLLVAAGGVALITQWSTGTLYLTLLPPLLAWGIGLGLLTPAVVSAAVSAVEPQRTGLASGINNTARQAGGAIGIAAYGAIAGPPANQGAFLSGLHIASLITAVLFVAATIGTVTFIPNPAPDRSVVSTSPPQSA